MKNSNTYILRGYCSANKGANIVQAYASKAAAKKRMEKMKSSGAYEKVEMCLQNIVYDASFPLMLEIWTA